jgi:hypothetical protein
LAPLILHSRIDRAGAKLGRSRGAPEVFASVRVTCYTIKPVLPKIADIDVP